MTEEQTSVAPITSQDPVAARERFQASLHGFVCYMQSPGVSVRTVWEQGRVSGEEEAQFIRDAVSWPSFRSVSSKERWATKRKAHWVEVRRRIESELLDRAVRREIEEVATLETMKLLVLARILGDVAAGIRPAKPRSLEGMVRAFIALDRLVTEKRRRVMAAVQADASQGDSTGLDDAVPDVAGEDDGFDDAEVLLMAEALAELRARG